MKGASPEPITLAVPCTMHSTLIHGPSRFDLLKNARRIREDLPGALLGWQKVYGNVVELPLKRRTFLLYSPSDIRHVLVTNQENYRKTGGILIGRRVFGQGLLASEGELHRAQRRILQPMFHQSSIAGYGAIMSAVITRTINSWSDSSEIDMALEMSQATLTIVGRSLFSLDLARDAHELHRALVAAQQYITRRQQAILPMPGFVPTPTAVRYWRGVRTFDRILHRMIAERRSQSERPHDILSLLLAARYDDGSSMPDTLIRDELLILLLAGHETTSNALTWAVYLLTQHPEAAKRLRSEVAGVAGSRAPCTGDIPHLPYTACVINETMRLFPPVWIVGRRSIGEDSLPGGIPIPAQANVAIPQYALHRDPLHFPEPERFLPERFLEKGNHPPYSFIPFGGGGRSCIGEGFARMEATLLLATMMQQVDFELVPGRKVVPDPLITLVPRAGLRVLVAKRGGTPGNPVPHHFPHSPQERTA